MKFTSMIAVLFIAGLANAQTAEKIVANYFENTGGYEAWGKLTSVKINGRVNQGGMDIPFEIVGLNDGRQYKKVSLQGNSIMKEVFDGETLWNTNMQTFRAEKANYESTENYKLEANDFPHNLYDYKKKGYTIKLVGEEAIHGTDAFKVKLTKEPISVEGETVEDVIFYYLDKENFIIIAHEEEILSGPNQGNTTLITYNNYDEVDGLYFPFSITHESEGRQPMLFSIDMIELNQAVDASIFKFPVEK